jgi:ABC-type uncharacterized transport system auxiliary subunit
MLASLSSLHSGLFATSGNAPRRRNYVQGAAFAVTLLLTVIGVSACGAARPIRYYQLNIPDVVPPANSEALPVSIVLGSLTTSHLYREDRIVYGLQGEGMGTYDYQRWAEPPTEMIQAMLLRDLRNTNRFRQVYSMKSAVHGDYVLYGQLYDFKEVSEPNLVARVSFELELRDTKKSVNVWNISYHQDEPVGAKDPATVVAALDKNIHRGLEQAVASIDQYFAAHPPTAEAAQK